MHRGAGRLVYYSLQDYLICFFLIMAKGGAGFHPESPWHHSHLPKSVKTRKKAESSLDEKSFRLKFFCIINLFFLITFSHVFFLPYSFHLPLLLVTRYYIMLLVDALWILRHQHPKLPTVRNLNHENQAVRLSTPFAIQSNPPPTTSPCSLARSSAPPEPLLPSAPLLSAPLPCAASPLPPPTTASPQLLSLVLTEPTPALSYVAHPKKTFDHFRTASSMPQLTA